ncbi:MAG: Ltp family lipoprotein [Rhodococcus sp. (in: high G+C Gram-positive bacteria)]
MAPDYNEQAAKSAENYFEFSSFSRQGLIDQLLYDGFTYEQAAYGVDQAGF